METGLVERIEFTERVAEMILKGMSEREIADFLDVKKTDVVKARKDWEAMLVSRSRSGMDLQTRVAQIIEHADEQYRLIIKEAWETVEQADSAQAFGSKNQALKIVKDTEQERVRMHQGLAENYSESLVDELEEMQKNQKILVDLLIKIKEEHPEVSEKIVSALNRMNGGDVEVIEISSES